MFSSNQVKPIKQALLALKEECHTLTNGSLQSFDVFAATGASFSRLLQSPIAGFFYGQSGGSAVNLVWGGKPVFFLRLHGSYPKHSYHLLRRTSVTELDNAYIVFADNYLVRHVWELHFFGYFEKLKAKGANLVEALHALIEKAELNVAGQMATEEKELGFFRYAAPKTSGTDLYFSHYFDVCGSYTINGQCISYKEFAANNQAWLTAGQPSDWNQPMKGFDTRKVRRIACKLTENDLAFLRAYNVRLLSPAFVFTFPYNRKFSGSINRVSTTGRTGFYFGEKQEVRRLFFQHYFKNLAAQDGGSSFKLLMEQGGVSEADLKQMLEVQDEVNLQSIADAAVGAPKAAKYQKPGRSIAVVTPNGNNLSANSMPGIVAAIWEDYAATAQLANLDQLLQGNSLLNDLVYRDLPSGEIQDVQTQEVFPKHFPNGRAAFKNTYTVGSDTGILTTQWRGGDNDNFTIFKDWATDLGYTFQ